jgi:hypothetical protein
MVIGGLLTAALVVGIVIWATLRGGSSEPTPPLPTAAPTPSTPTAGLPTSGILAVRTFDPNGTDTTENDNLADRAIDGNPDTSWTTLCYSDRFLNGKPGVGLVADLGSARSGTLRVDIASAPSQVRVYTAPEGAAPTSFGGWGEPVRRFDRPSPGSFDATLTDARWVLVSFVELGEDVTCTERNPYRGAIAEMRFG